jgi:hypothetical protein
MISFGTFLAEALAIEPTLQIVCAWCNTVMQRGDPNHISHGICPKCAKTWGPLDEAVSPPGAQLFHKDIGIPATLAGPRPGLRLNYSNHAKRAALDDGLKSVPASLPAQFTVIEVESLRGQPLKWVVRMERENTTRDLVLVVQPDGFVRTVWTNERNDAHKTLKRHLYTPPQQFRAN